MTAPEQPSLFVLPAAPILTERQALALKLVTDFGGLDAAELGAHLHARRGTHEAGGRCAYCGTEGRSVLSALRKKGLVVRRKTGSWQPTGPPGTSTVPSESAADDPWVGGVGEIPF